MEKKLIIITLLTLLIPIIVGGAENHCDNIIEPGDIPCQLISTWVYNTQCNETTIRIYNNTGGIISDRVMDNWGTSGYCNITFNYTTPGIYKFNTTTGDSATITIKDNDYQFYLYIIALTLFLTLLGLGVWLENPYLTTLSGMMGVIIAINLYTNGYPGLTNTFIKHSIIIIIAGIGFYLMIIPWLDEWQGYNITKKEEDY